MTLGTASRRRSSTTRMPSRSDSSRMSVTPSIFLSLTSPAICSMRRVLFTWYGIWVTTMRSFPFLPPSSTVARARMAMMPRPVL